MQKRIIKKMELHSQYLGEIKQILVSLPSDADPNAAYPLLVLHDGPDYFNLGRIVTQGLQLMAEGIIQPLVMVAIPVNKENRTAEYSPIGHRQPNHIRMVIEELLPRLRKEFPVSTQKEDLVIGGSSLGGTISLHIALQFPEVCQKVITQSGAFLTATQDAILKEQSLEHLTIYQSIGLSETAVPTHMGALDFVTRNREVYRLLVEKKATVHYVEAEGDHTWGFWQRDIPQALRVFFGK